MVSKIESDLQHSMSDTLVMAGISAKQLVGLKIDRVSLGKIRPTISSLTLRQGGHTIALDVKIT